MVRLGIPALIPLIRHDLGLDRIQVISSILNAGSAAAGIPAGKAVDRFGERLVLGYGAIGSGVVILGVTGVSSFAMLLPILIVTGLLTTTSVPAGGKVVVGCPR
jgi:MFS family permease